MKRKILCGRCGKRTSPVFVKREIRELEQNYSDRKQRFDVSLIAGVKRCRYGKIQVIICRPFSRKARPFPTTFWLVCPYLIKLAGKIESSGGVHELEEYIISHNLVHEWRKYNILHQVIRLKLSGKFTNKFMFKFKRKIFREVMRGGIGGIRASEGVNVKCLHLQTASFIALGHHPAGEWLRSKGLCEDCGKNICGGKIIV